MRNVRTIAIFLVLVAAIFSIYSSFKTMTVLKAIEPGNISSFNILAQRIEDGEYTIDDVLNDVKFIISSEERISEGVRKIRYSYFFWIFSFAVLLGGQIFVLMKLKNPSE